VTKSRKTVLLVLGALVLVLSGAVYLGLQALELSENAPQMVWNALTALFLVALTFERALEVLVTTFREPGAIPLKYEVERVQERLDFIPKDTRLPAATKLDVETQLVEEHARARKALDEYKSGTQVVSLAVSLVGAVIVSAVGFRVLATVVASTPAQGTFQGAAFAVIDVLLTGGLIAGGSKGIHALTQAVGEVLDAARTRSAAK
jgi:hypothetical protein